MGQFGVMIGQLVGFLIMLMVGYGCVRLRFYGQTALDLSLIHISEPTRH